MLCVQLGKQTTRPTACQLKNMITTSLGLVWLYWHMTVFADILTCHHRKSTDLSHFNVSNSCITFRWAGSRTLVSFMVERLSTVCSHKIKLHTSHTSIYFSVTRPLPIEHEVTFCVILTVLDGKLHTSCCVNSAEKLILELSTATWNLTSILCQTSLLKGFYNAGISHSNQHRKTTSVTNTDNI